MQRGMRNIRVFRGFEDLYHNRKYAFRSDNIVICENEVAMAHTR